MTNLRYGYVARRSRLTLALRCAERGGGRHVTCSLGICTGLIITCFSFKVVLKPAQPIREGVRLQMAVCIAYRVRTRLLHFFFAFFSNNFEFHKLEKIQVVSGFEPTSTPCAREPGALTTCSILSCAKEGCSLYSFNLFFSNMFEFHKSEKIQVVSGSEPTSTPCAREPGALTTCSILSCGKGVVSYSKYDNMLMFSHF